MRDSVKNKTATRVAVLVWLFTKKGDDKFVTEMVNTENKNRKVKTDNYNIMHVCIMSFTKEFFLHLVLLSSILNNNTFSCLSKMTKN